jgi:hypothetical protein
MSNDGGTLDEPLLQFGCGQKRSYDEMNDGAIDEVSDNFFCCDKCQASESQKVPNHGCALHCSVYEHVCSFGAPRVS